LKGPFLSGLPFWCWKEAVLSQTKLGILLRINSQSGFSGSSGKCCQLGTFLAQLSPFRVCYLQRKETKESFPHHAPTVADNWAQLLWRWQLRAAASVPASCRITGRGVYLYWSITVLLMLVGKPWRVTLLDAGLCRSLLTGIQVKDPSKKDSTIGTLVFFSIWCWALRYGTSQVN